MRDPDARPPDEAPSDDPSPIVAVTSGERRHTTVLGRAADLAGETGGTILLFDLDSRVSALESPLPTAWSADGEDDRTAEALDPDALEAAGQGRLAGQVRTLRQLGRDAWGWPAPRPEADDLLEFAARRGAGLVLVSADDTDLIAALRRAAEEQAAGDPGAAGRRIHVEAVPPA